MFVCACMDMHECVKFCHLECTSSISVYLSLPRSLKLKRTVIVTLVHLMYYLFSIATDSLA